MRAASTDFGPGMYAGRAVRATLRDAEALFGQAIEAAGKRLPEAGVTSLDNWMTSHDENLPGIRGGIFSWNMDTVERILRSCVEMAESIGLLLDTNGRVSVSPFVLERSLGEAIMRICYILDKSIPPARSIARMAAYQLESIEGNLRAAWAFGANGKSEAVRARENIAEMHELLADNGFELTPDLRREPFTLSVAFDGQRENIKFDATAAFKRYLPSRPWQYELGSGVTHSRGWMLSGLVETSAIESLTSDVEATMAVAGSVLELADTFAHAAAGHTGVDVDWYLKKNHQRRLGIASWTSNPEGFSVDHAEYASRGPDWKPRDVIISETFRNRPR